MEHSHSHSAAGAHAGRLRLVLLLTGGYTAVEIAGGILTGSLALVADAGHMLTDVFGLGMALLAINFAARPATAQKSYGFYRLEILAALANGLLLFGISAYILFEAYQRFTDPPEVAGAQMLGIAAVGMAVNVASAYLLMEGQKSSINMRGAFLEVISDLLGSAAVIVAGLLIVVTGVYEIDPIASVVIGLFILPRTWKLMSDAVHILLEGTPRHIDVEIVRQHILETDGVVSAHDLHVWSVTSGMDVVSAHVVIDDNANARRVLDSLSECLGEHFDIEHSTFQIERSDRSEREHARH